MSDLDLNRLTCFASIQQSFPNDDLKLFDVSATPSKMASFMLSSSNLSQTVRSNKNELDNVNVQNGYAYDINATPVNTTQSKYIKPSILNFSQVLDNFYLLFILLFRF